MRNSLIVPWVLVLVCFLYGVFMTLKYIQTKREFNESVLVAESSLVLLEDLQEVNSKQQEQIQKLVPYAEMFLKNK